MARKKQEDAAAPEEQPAEEPVAEEVAAEQPVEEPAAEEQPVEEPAKPKHDASPEEVEQLAREIYCIAGVMGPKGFNPSHAVDRAFDLAESWYTALAARKG